MESESGTTNTKISDSGYSINCSNSNSQRSASSKSRHSGSNSSRSSGYCGGATTNPDGSVSTAGQQPPKRNKDKEHKKKKLRSSSSLSSPVAPLPPTTESTSATSTELPKSESMGIETQQPPTVETAVSDAENRPETLPNPPSDVAPSVPVRAETEQSSPAWNEVCEADPVEETKALEKPTYPDESSKVPSGQQPEDGFCCVISMYDGVVLYTTPSLTSVLGFPKDMWLGRSFIDFVHPKDRNTFSTQVSTGVALPLVDFQGKHKDVKNCLYVYLRKYRGLKTSGFGVVEKAVSYQAFQLTVTFRHTADVPETKHLISNCGMFLVVVAVPVYSAYKVPEERTNTNKFGMRHTAACVFSHVDPDVVTNFGFMPQDMLGKSVFDFYHPEDMPFLKEVYKSVMKVCQIAGSVFRSKPYRFAVQNGGFVMIETEWSSFVNPWSRRLEFVIGLHKVLQGPQNPDLFDTKNKKEIIVTEAVLKESKHIQGEILLLLNEELPKPVEVARQEVSQRCKNLANFMETLMEEVNKSNLQIDLPLNHGSTVSERASVMLGEISPHHDYYDSKSSSETPPSYNQLNYNENIERFFQSKPKTTVSDESNNGQTNNETEQERKNVPDCPANNQKCLSPSQNSGASGSGSAENLSSGSNANMESGSATNMSNDSYKPPHLTESLLNRHNEDMEKIMLKRYKHHRFINKERETKKSHQKIEKLINNEKANMDKAEASNYTHGVKRSGSYSWEEDCHKILKQKHTAGTGAQKQNFRSANQTSNKNVAPDQPVVTSMATGSTEFKSGQNDVNLWPPFSVTVTSMNNTQPCTMTAGQPPPPYAPHGMFPVYYIPQQPIPPPRYSVPYMPGMLYNYGALFPAPPPLLCSPLPVLPVPLASSLGSAAAAGDGRAVGTVANTANVNAGSATVLMQVDGTNTLAPFPRPSSQATSVKVQPGSSAVGSIASASVANKALSECSRKDLALQSVCSPGSPLVSPPDGEPDMGNFSAPNKVNESTTKKTHESGNRYTRKPVYEDSSNSSSYSSFLKTDTASGSNDDTNSKQASSVFRDTKKGCFPARKKDPPWVESVSVSPDLIYRYQVAVRDIEEILKADLNTLKEITQPGMVNDQLNQLYLEMELAGLSKKLTLEEGFTTSSSSSEEDNRANTSKPKKKRRSYSSLMMIYEENAPFPPPDD